MNEVNRESILAEQLRQELLSLQVPPIAVVCLPEFYQRLLAKNPQSAESLGPRILQSSCLSIPGEVPHSAPFRFFFDEEELQLFLSSELQMRSPDHYSRNLTERSSLGFSEDIEGKTNNLLSSFTEILSDTL